MARKSDSNSRSVAPTFMLYHHRLGTGLSQSLKLLQNASLKFGRFDMAMFSRRRIAPEGAAARPARLLFVQTQSIAAGAQEISRILGEQLAAQHTDGRPDFEIHHLFFYRITDAFDGLENVYFCDQRAPRNPLSFIRFLFRLFVLIRRIRPDVALTFQHYGNIVAAPVARLLGVPRIIANHVSAPATISKTVRWLDRVIGLTGFYDVITVNSHVTWRDYQAYPARYARRLVHIPHGFAERHSAAGKAEVRAAFGLPVDGAVIGTVARLHPLKQLDAAIRALAHLPGTQLAFAGAGPDETRLQELARQMGLADRVHFLGELHPDRIGDFLACLDVFAFPSLAETFGLAPVEAAQAGIPVVTNDLPVLREVLDVDGQPCALFVDASDAEAFAASIRRVLDDPALAGRLSSLGRRLSERYSLSAMVDAYRGLIAGELPQHGLSGRKRATDELARRGGEP